MAAPRLQLFGPPAWDGQVLPPERRWRLAAVLAVTAVTDVLAPAGTAVPRERLAALFWPGREGAVARTNLRKLLLELRELGLPGLEDGAAGLRWSPDSDLLRFHEAAGRGDWPAAAAGVRGPLLQGLGAGDRSMAFEAWLQGERRQWLQRWQRGLLQSLARGQLAPPDLAVACAPLQAQGPLGEEIVVAWLAAARASGHAGAIAAAEAALQAQLRQLAAADDGQPPRRLLELAAAAPVPVAPPGAPALRRLHGRETALAQALAALQGGARLLTVLGPGGVGKSTLAQHLLALLAPAQAAAWRVALDELSAPAQLPGRIASAIDPGIALGPDAVASLSARWPAGRSLLLLDGFEHLVDAAATVQRLLALQPELVVIVTSRERLDVDGEWLLPLPSLGAPAPDAAPSEVLAHAAVRLFCERARALGPGVDAPAHAESLRRIATATGGLPLALELAAALLRVMPVDELAAELQRGTALPQAAGRSIEAVFAQSWALLTAAERGAYTRLAVFRGGFTRAAAAQVAGVGLPLLAALLDKSMLSRGVAGGADVDANAGRFDRHPWLHGQAQQQLAAQPALAAELAERHGQWCLALLQHVPGPQEGGHAARRAALAAERANLLAAWQGWVERRDAASLTAAAPAMDWFHVVEGRLPDAVGLFEAAASALGEASASGAVLRAHQAWLSLWLGQSEVAEAMSRRLVAPLRRAGQHRAAVLALRTAAHAARVAGRAGESAAWLLQALALAREMADPGLRALLLDAQAMALLLLGRRTRALALVRAAMRVNDRLGHEAQRMYNEFNLSQALAAGGSDDELAAARAWARAARERAERIGYRYFLPYTRCQCAALALRAGDVEAAAAEIGCALDTAGAIGGAPALAWAHELQAQLALARGDPRAARTAARQAAAAALSAGHGLFGAGAVRAAAAAEAALGEPARGRAWLGALLALGHWPALVRDGLQSAARAMAVGVASDVAREAAHGAAPAAALRPSTLEDLLRRVIAGH